MTPGLDVIIADGQREGDIALAAKKNRNESKGVWGRRAVTWSPVIGGTVAAAVAATVLLILNTVTFGVGALIVGGAFVLGAIIGQVVKSQIRKKVEAPAPVATIPYNIFDIRTRIPFVGGAPICSEVVLEKFIVALANNRNREEVQSKLVTLRSMFYEIQRHPEKGPTIQLNDELIDGLRLKGDPNSLYGQWWRNRLAGNESMKPPSPSSYYEDIRDVDSDNKESPVSRATFAQNRPYNPAAAEDLFTALIDSSDSDDALFPAAASSASSESSDSGRGSPMEEEVSSASTEDSSAPVAPPSPQMNHKLALALANAHVDPQTLEQTRSYKRELRRLNKALG